jgi:diguanylate cyclase (GGDEF)-like protein/PAS domain S-box-containing protein
MGDSYKKYRMHRIVAAARGVWLRDAVRALAGNAGAIRQWAGGCADIDERKPADHAHNYLIALLDISPDFVKIADPDGRMLYINRAGRRMLGIGPEDDISKRTITDNHPPWADELIRNEGIPKAMREGLWRSETALLDAFGQEIPVSQLIVVHKTDDERIEFIASVARDISERKRLEELLRHQATHDSLTGLANRGLLFHWFEQALISAEKQSHLVAVLFVDMNDFKRINDTCGHAAGDEILCMAARRLAGCVRETDLVARYGGDEFVVALSDVCHITDVTPVLQKIEDVFARPFMWGDQELLFTCSLGIAIYPKDGRDADTLLKKADATMYRVKELTRTGELSALRVGTKTQKQKVSSLEGELRRVMEELDTHAGGPRAID